MNVPVRELNRFLYTQMFFSLALCSLLAIVMYAGRYLLAGYNPAYPNLPWNLFLAWLPYLFSLAAAAFYRLSSKTWLLQIPLGGVWLIFFPNAPYLVTDFLHLTPYASIPLWYDTILLASFAWSGCFLAIASLQIMQRLIRNYWGAGISWFFVFIALALSGLGTYLGRFERWNSWDLFIHPKTILRDVLIYLKDPFDYPRFVGFTLLFSAFLMVCYLTFISVRNIDQS